MLDKRIKKIDINYNNSYICINNKYFIDISQKNATIYNMKNNDDIPLYIFQFCRANGLISY